MDAGGGLIRRQVEQVLDESLDAFRAVVLHGPRQSGKTTVARLLAQRRGAAYRTMDDDAERAAATADPAGYLAATGTPMVIDEIQRVGEPLVLAVKAVVDRDRRPGQFLLTGSSDFLTVPTISETLAGRIDIVELWPLAQSELETGTAPFVDRTMNGGVDGLLRDVSEPLSRSDYFDVVARGGYPEVQRMGARARSRWFGAYLRTVLDREIEDSRDVRDRDALDATARLLAATTAQELVIANLARRLGINRVTAERYQLWLERVFLVHRVPGWGRGLTSKVVLRPKVYMVDTGLAAALAGRASAALQRPTEPAAGPLVESLVASELVRQLGWGETDARLYHLRKDAREVDLVVEAADGRVIGLEVKATTTARAGDFTGLEFLRDLLDRVGVPFVAGLVLHTGEARRPFGDRLAALPISDLWRSA